jgi:hypothetical protein
MAFYNRVLAQQVQKFTDLFGKVQPLDVVIYGGASRITATTTTSVAVLGAPPAGFVYRLQRVAYTVGAGAFGGLFGASSSFPYSVLNSATPPLGADNCMGQLASEGLTLIAGGGVSISLAVTYDLVTTPSIS